MSLHQSFKQNQGQKETVFATVPSIADLSHAYNTALKTKRKAVILSWKSRGNPTTFYLTVICNDPNSELPDWYLSRCEDGGTRRDIWQHSSPDTTLIYELIQLEEQSSTVTSVNAVASPAATQTFADNWGAPAPQEEAAPLDPASWASGRAPNATPQPAVMGLPPIESPFPGGGLLKAPEQNVTARQAPPATSPPSFDSGQYPAQKMHSQPLDISGEHRAQALNAPAPMNISAQQAQQAAPPSRPLPPPVELDRSLVDGVMRGLSNLETGLLSHQAFLFFLVREFTQFKSTQLPFSLIVAEFFINTPTNGVVALPPAYRRLSAHCLLAAARPLDLAAHYEQNEFALLLPNTPRADALPLAAKVIEACKTAPMPPEMSASSLLVCLGLSTFPTDSSHPGIFLAAAIEAKNEAKMNGVPLVVFGAS